ncbi:hypothetical protein UFOVP806_18 [uncultured Caudovirales phage]|uniref:PD-(D/E)XK nuclease superfamily n=1 Tax=uncultured Caudovirales phage TaxID=2100421 RepID=A0A6J5P0J6_9CAUD|nr:hypothetical protein UFOVP806_18 [uncultured Caudovirales phage]
MNETIISDEPINSVLSKKELAALKKAEAARAKALAKEQAAIEKAEAKALAEKAKADAKAIALAEKLAAKEIKPDFESGLGTILADIRVKYANLKRAEPKRNYLGASSWGKECKRELAYGWHRVEPDQPPFSPELFAIFSMGHAGEPVVVEMMRTMFTIVTEKKDGKQFAFYAAEGKLSGHCDGIITDGPTHKADGTPLVYPMIWENKMLNSKSWKKTKADGIKKSKPIYYAQLNSYAAYFDVPNGGIISCMNRDTGELYIEHVPFDGLNAQESSDRALDVIQSESPEEFPRIHDDPDWWQCTYCDYRLRCHGIQKPLTMSLPCIK